MSTAVVKTSKIIKSATSTVRAHFDVVERAREVYLSAIKRAEMEYYDRIKRATAIITGEEDAPSDNAAAAETSPAAQPAEAST